jgi:hypothetical protein
MTPQYQHDCEKCIFLGKLGDTDMYYHPTKLSVIGTTYILRKSELGSDYASSCDFDDKIYNKTKAGLSFGDGITEEEQELHLRLETFFQVMKGSLACYFAWRKEWGT